MSRRDFQLLGLARTVYHLDLSRRHFSLHSPAHEGVADLSADQKRGNDVEHSHSNEAFTKWENLKRVLISLFGATAGQGVVWYTGQFYALFYLQTILKVNSRSANYIIAIALLLGDAVLCVLRSACLIASAASGS